MGMSCLFNKVTGHVPFLDNYELVLLTSQMSHRRDIPQIAYPTPSFACKYKDDIQCMACTNLNNWIYIILRPVSMSLENIFYAAMGFTNH